MSRKYFYGCLLDPSYSVIFSILDDMEMYEQQKPFKLTDFIVMSNFFNLFLYKAVSGNLFGK